jgi:hypothetical protein
MPHPVAPFPVQRRKKTMRALKIAALSMAVLLTAAAPLVLAQSVRSDLTVCCAELNSLVAPPAVPATGINPQALGCKAIDGSNHSISACSADGDVVLGCTLSGFICQPSQKYSGLADCLCPNNRGLAGAF